jgi:1-hydroxycarotenoid 3,4-desaturase
VSPGGARPPHVVVIGAGAGGLAAALGLAVRGARVTVLEARDEPGGKMGTVTLDGVTCDTGPSLLTMPDVLEGLLVEAGTTLAAEVTLRRLDPAFRYLYDDGTALRVFHETAATLAEVRTVLGAPAEAELAHFLDYARRIWDAAAPAFVYGPSPGVSSLRAYGAGLGLVHALAAIDPLRSQWSAITAQVKDPHLRQLLARYATYNGSHPWRAPATLNCIAHVELALGGYGVEGGLHAVATALQRVAERHGVTFRFGARVQSIRLKPLVGVQGVVLESGEVLNADAVVVNADVANLVGAFLPSPPASLKARLKGPLAPQPSMSGWTALIRARIDHDPDRAPHTVLFTADYAAEFADIFDRRRPPTDPTIYLCAQSRAHGRATWRGDAEALFVMVNAPPTELAARGVAATDEAYAALEARVVEKLVARGLIAAGDDVVWRRSPADLERAFPGSRGSIYGASSNGATAAFLRVPNRIAEVRGLYVASGGAHPGGGVPMCLLSGKQAASACARDLSLS